MADTRTQLRNRIVDRRDIPGRELLDHDGNPRYHPLMQRDATRGLLEEVGIVRPLMAYHSARNGGALTLVDGHMRKEEYPDALWPVDVLDLDDEEADKVLLLLDPIGALAQQTRDESAALADNVLTGNLALRELMRSIVSGSIDPEAEGAEVAKGAAGDDGPPEMALQPFEHYDYVLVVFKSTLDWERALTLLGMQRETFVPRSRSHWDGKIRKVGLGRVIDGSQLLLRLQPAHESRIEGLAVESTPGTVVPQPAPLGVGSVKRRR
jgi:hypothetical protein